MKKVRNIFLMSEQDIIENGNSYLTGLVLELEDGTLAYQQTTDVLQPYKLVQPGKPIDKPTTELD